MLGRGFLGFPFAICLSMNWEAIRLIALSTLLRPGLISSLPASIPAMARGEHVHVHSLLPLHLLRKLGSKQRRVDRAGRQLDHSYARAIELHAQGLGERM